MACGGCVVRTFTAEEHSVLVYDRHTSFVSLSFHATYVYVLPSITITFYITYTTYNSKLGRAVRCTEDHCLPTTRTTPSQTPLIHKSFAKFSFPSFAYIMYLNIYIRAHFTSHIYVYIRKCICLIYGKLILHVVPSPHRSRLSPRFRSYT